MKPHSSPEKDRRTTARARVGEVLDVSEKKLAQIIRDISQLATVFGGTLEDCRNSVVGMAIASQIMNRQFGSADDLGALVSKVEVVLLELVESKRKSQFVKKQAAGEIRAQILSGMKEQAKSSPKDSQIWAVIDALEIKN
jgi:hypothetical protein